MSLVDAIATRQKYDQMKVLVGNKTDEFYEKLVTLYEEQLILVNLDHKNAASICQNNNNKSFQFNLLGSIFTLTRLEELAIVVSEDQIFDKIKMVPRISAVVNNRRLGEHLSGCIALTVLTSKNKHFSLLRVFVNHNGDIAFEYGAGWKHRIYFQSAEIDDKLIDDIFHIPISSYLLELCEEWAPLKEVLMVEKIEDLDPYSNQIDFY